MGEELRVEDSPGFHSQGLNQILFGRALMVDHGLLDFKILHI